MVRLGTRAFGLSAVTITLAAAAPQRHIVDGPNQATNAKVAEVVDGAIKNEQLTEHENEKCYLRAKAYPREDQQTSYIDCIQALMAQRNYRPAPRQ